MAVFRCPKHDVLFHAEKPPTQHGHAKCPHCNPQAKPKDEAATQSAETGQQQE
jgi:hypothetical protein